MARRLRRRPDRDLGELYGVREEDIQEFIQVRLLPELEQVIIQHMRV